jgi:hypothetical protein
MKSEEPNPKSEARNPNDSRGLSDLEFRISFGFGISDFEFVG